MRFRIALAALAAFSLLPGCDSVFGGDSIDGVWQSREESDGYLVIDLDDERLAAYFETTEIDNPDDECYFRFEAEIESLGDDEYRVRAEGEPAETVTIRRDDDVLVVQFEDGNQTGTERYDESDRDENEFRPICSFDVLAPETSSLFAR